MDPITTAIVTAVGTGLAKDVIKDSYEALKAALKKKSGYESDLVDAVDKLEKKPDSEARKATIQEEVGIAKVNDDPEIVKLAQDLLKQLKVAESAGGSINIGGNVKGVVATNISGGTITQGDIS
jgi:hypothetical protein